MHSFVNRAAPTGKRKARPDAWKEHVIHNTSPKGVVDAECIYCKVRWKTSFGRIKEHLSGITGNLNNLMHFDVE